MGAVLGYERLARRNRLAQPDKNYTFVTVSLKLTNPRLNLDGPKAPSYMSSVFLSHTSTDKPFARKLATKLALFGVRSWIDEFEMLPGDSLIAKIEQGLTSVDYVAVILSPSSVGSEWVTREFRAALQGEIASRKISIIPIVVWDCEIPVFLRDKLYADFRADFYGGLWSLLRRLLGDEALSGASADSVRSWSENHSSVRPLDKFLAYVRNQEQLEERKARFKSVRDSTLSAGFEGLIQILSREDAPDHIQRLAEVFCCATRCHHCARPIIDVESLSEQICATLEVPGSATPLQNAISSRLRGLNLEDSFSNPLYCDDCDWSEPYRNQGAD